MLQRGFLAALVLILCAAPLAAQAVPAPAELAEAPPRLAVPAKWIDFDYAGDSRGAFQNLARLFGLRVLFDDELAAKPLQVSLRKARFEVVADVLSQLSKSFWVPVDERTILVAPDTTAKRQRYEPEITKTLLAAGATTEQFNEILQSLRVLLDMKRVTSDTRTHSLTIRDTPARVEVAERLLHSLIEASPEVQVDLQVLELDLRRARQVGIVPPEKAQILNIAQGLSSAQLLQLLLQVTGGTTATQLQSLLSGAGVSALNIPPFTLFGGGRTLFAANLPGATANLSWIASAVRQSQSLTLRAREGQTAKMNIGARVPVIFVSFSSSFFSPQQQQLIQQGVFQNPFPAIQYQDTGVTVSMTPFVHAGREVTLKLKFEIVLETGQSFNNVQVFSERQVEHTVRLKEGETALLTGLLADTETLTREGTPGIDALLSNRNRERNVTELVLLVTPHIVRASPLDEPEPPPLYIGTETFLRSR